MSKFGAPYCILIKTVENNNNNNNKERVNLEAHWYGYWDIFLNSCGCQMSVSSVFPSNLLHPTLGCRRNDNDDNNNNKEIVNLEAHWWGYWGWHGYQMSHILGLTWISDVSYLASKQHVLEQLVLELKKCLTRQKSLW